MPCFAKAKTICTVGQGTNYKFAPAWEVIFKDGYYEVNGVKFSDYYYNKLWNTGRGGSSLVANEILKGATSRTPDLIKPGFFKYVFGEWEMIYNPVTNEVWHIQPIK